MQTDLLLDFKSPAGPSEIPTFARAKFRNVPELRGYQIEGISAFKAWWDEQTREGLISLATGMGKTITACECVSWLLDKGKKVLWLTHSEDLVIQSGNTLEQYLGLPVGVEQAEKRLSKHSQVSVVVASIPTLQDERLAEFSSWFKPDILVFDEAHHRPAKTWIAVRNAFAEAKVLNLTATPYRQDITGRLNLGTVLVEKSTSEGISMGFLVPPKILGTIKLNFRGVTVALGDYDASSLSKFLLRPDIMEECSKQLLSILPEHRTILFAASLTHAKAIANLVREKAQTIAVHEVYGETAGTERQRIYCEVRANSNSLLICNLVLREGFDLPELDQVAIFRPTKNAGLYIQMLGRGLRKAQGKACCGVLDIVDLPKTKSRKSPLILPTEQDIQRVSALDHKPYSWLQIFMGWFIREDELELPSRKTNLGPLSLLQSIQPKIDWTTERKISRVGEIQKIRADIAMTPLSALQKVLFFSEVPYAETFVYLMRVAGWVYCPHNEIPTSKYSVTDAEELLAEEEKTVGLENSDLLSTLDPKLKNFMIDILGSPKRGLAVDKYTVMHQVEGMDITWFKPIYHSTFSYIESKGERGEKIFWVLSDDKIYQFVSHKKHVTHVAVTGSIYSQLPDYVKRTDWLSRKASLEQVKHIERILNISTPEVDKLNLSKLGASAILSSDFSKNELQQIANILKLVRGK